MLAKLNDWDRRLSGGGEPSGLGSELTFLAAVLILGGVAWWLNSPGVAIGAVLGAALGRLLTLVIRRATAAEPPRLDER